MGCIVINWIIFAIVCVLCTYYVLSLYKERKISAKGKVSLLLTLIGIFLTIGTEFLSQFNYNLYKIAEKIVYPKEKLDFGQIKVNQNTTNPHYIFALDVSGSMKDGKEVPYTPQIDSKVKNIKKNGISSTDSWNFDVNKGKIKFYRLLQVRLMNSIIKLERDKRKNNLNYTYSVVLFAGSPHEIEESLSKAEVFDKIYHHDFSGEKTNFIELFEYLCTKINDLSVNTKDRYKPVDCHIVLFSDYMHDGEFNDKQELEQKLKTSLQEIHRKNVNLRFYYLDDDKKKNGLPVEDILKSVFPKSRVGLLDEDDELICPIISDTPISFFYNNSLFEEELITHIKFDGLTHKKDFYFGLGRFDNNDIDSYDELKQEYYLIDGTDTFHLSSYLQGIKLDLNDEIEFKIKGYIPAPYKSPDIIIKDEEEKIQYIVPVLFYRNLPLTGYLMLIIIIPIFIFVICKK